ncbi:hypothetical protein H6F51_10525 [Cyanobacteria bacterium FACHB-DQ100]|nr:hypothetical protein [Cyanobacteria bacterium FACHB-DQ100]
MPTRRTTTVQPPVMSAPQPTSYGGGEQILMYAPDGHGVLVGEDAIVYRTYRDLNPHTNPNAVIDWAWQGSSILFRRPIRSITGGALILIVLMGGWNLFTGTFLVAIGAAKPVSLSQVKDKTSISHVSYALGSSFGAPIARGTTATLVNFAKETTPQVVWVEDRKTAPKGDDLEQALTEVRYVRHSER